MCPSTKQIGDAFVIVPIEAHHNAKHREGRAGDESQIDAEQDDTYKRYQPRELREAKDGMTN